MSYNYTVVGRSDGPLDVQELQRDLARKYRNVGGKVQTIWRSFTIKQREQAMRGSVGDGKVLKHSRDRSLGVVRTYIPDYNLKEMISRPEHFLNMFEFRALTPLYDQLYAGTNGVPGDRELMEKSGMRHGEVSQTAKTAFIEGEHYGRSFEPTADLPFEKADLIIVPSSIGQLVMLRQQFLFQFLNHIVEEILDLGSQTRQTSTSDQKENAALDTALSILSIEPKSSTNTFQEVYAQAMESRTALEDYLFLLGNEPIVLNHDVNAAYRSRAELVPDDRGRILPAVTDRYLSAAFLDSVASAVKATAIWDYISHLLRHLEIATHKTERSSILQELSNTCHLEYHRTQESFKRKVAVHVASKRFKRMTDNVSGQAKIVMKGNPADCTISDPQLHFIAFREAFHEVSSSGLYVMDQVRVSDGRLGILDLTQRWLNLQLLPSCFAKRRADHIAPATCVRDRSLRADRSGKEIA